MKITKRPISVEAEQWLGGDYKWLDMFCGKNWSRADAVSYSQQTDEEALVIFNTAEQCWLHVPVNHWIIRGVNGELYPCAPDILEKTYYKA